MKTFKFAFPAACLLLAACVSTPAKKTGPERFFLQKTSFDRLQGWKADDLAQALEPLRRSCARIMKKAPTDTIGTDGYAGTAADWQVACKALPADNGDAHAYFESQFTPYALIGEKGREGLFTGYYEPSLRGSLVRTDKYSIPLYARPKDMLTAKLGDFIPEMKGKTITGRVDGDTFIPYYDRAEIEDGALELQDKIVWVDSAVDAFFLHIQGSGRVTMEDGTALHVGYTAQNGKAYTAIGKTLLERGELQKENVSMQSIRAWLEAHPDQAAEVMNVNESYVFFRALDGKDGPLGAEGVALVPERSMAVDKRIIPYGTPVWIDADEPDNEGRLQKLMMAQDTGGAINGAVRGDYFWGAGERAADKAGRMKSRGTAVLLLPVGVVVPDGKLR
jgi:membrane-bound lytic murein transglycosylase A